MQTPLAKVATLEKERNDLQKERNDLQKELATVKAKMDKVNQDFSELQKNFLAQEEAIARMKSSNVQVRMVDLIAGRLLD